MKAARETPTSNKEKAIGPCVLAISGLCWDSSLWTRFLSAVTGASFSEFCKVMAKNVRDATDEAVCRLQ